MKLMIDIDEKRFRDIQRISEVQLKRRTPTLEQVVANGTPIEQEPILDKIRAEIKQLPYQRIFGNVSNYSLLDTVIEIIDKYRSEEK